MFQAFRMLKGEVWIKDVIVSKSGYTNTEKIYVIANRYPEYKYERHKGFLVANDSGFHACLKEHHSRYDKAFAGREFTVNMKNEADLKATGQFWDAAHPDTKELDLIHVGVSTLEALSNCYVFTSAEVERHIIKNWLDWNTPKTNYWHYDKRKRGNA